MEEKKKEVKKSIETLKVMKVEKNIQSPFENESIKLISLPPIEKIDIDHLNQKNNHTPKKAIITNGNHQTKKNQNIKHEKEIYYLFFNIGGLKKSVQFAIVYTGFFFCSFKRCYVFFIKIFFLTE